MICKHCNANLSDTAAFCGKCGSQQGEDQGQQLVPQAQLAPIPENQIVATAPNMSAVKKGVPPWAVALGFVAMLAVVLIIGTFFLKEDPTIPYQEYLEQFNVLDAKVESLVDPINFAINEKDGDVYLGLNTYVADVTASLRTFEGATVPSDLQPLHTAYVEEVDLFLEYVSFLAVVGEDYWNKNFLDIVGDSMNMLFDNPELWSAHWSDVVLSGVTLGQSYTDVYDDTISAVTLHYQNSDSLSQQLYNEIIKKTE